MSGLSLVLILMTILFSCESSDQKDESHVKKYCSSHLLPDPATTKNNLGEGDSSHYGGSDSKNLTR